MVGTDVCVFRDLLLIIVPDYLVQVTEYPESLDELRTLAGEMFSYESPVFYSASGDSIQNVAVLRLLFSLQAHIFCTRVRKRR